MGNINRLGPVQWGQTHTAAFQEDIATYIQRGRCTGTLVKNGQRCGGKNTNTIETWIPAAVGLPIWESGCRLFVGAWCKPNILRKRVGFQSNGPNMCAQNGAFDWQQRSVQVKEWEVFGVQSLPHPPFQPSEGTVTLAGWPKLFQASIGAAPRVLIEDPIKPIIHTVHY